MNRKPIKRKVAKLDTSNQASFFHILDQQTATDIEVAPTCPPGHPLAVQFVAPDPKTILINQVRLDDHLKQVGQTTPLKIRSLLESVSFEVFEKDYLPVGRPPYAPRAMLGLILLGIMQGVTSLRDLERFARLDLGCWWVTGGILPDHSIIGRFIQRHAELLTEAFFEQLTGQVLKVTRSGVAVVAGDGTIIEAAASRYGLMRQEALKEALEDALLAKVGADDDDERYRAHCKARLEKLEQAKAALEQRQAEREKRGKDAETTQIHPQEHEAVVQPQKDKKRYQASYKPQVVANEARVIVACGIHPSSENEILPNLLDQAQSHGTIETGLLDAGYFSNGIIEATEQREIELLCPEGRSQGHDWNKQSDKSFLKNQFSYDAEQDHYVCPNGQKLTRVGVYKGNENSPAYTEYGTSACAGCPLRSRCTQSTGGRRIKRYSGDAAKEALRAKMADPAVRARYVKRQAMVEPVFSHLRSRQNLHRFRRKGLKAVRLEFTLHAMAYNLSRVAALGRFMAAGFIQELLNRTQTGSVAGNHPRGFSWPKVSRAYSAG